MKHRPNRIIIPIIFLAVVLGYFIWRLSTPAPEPQGIIAGNGVMEATEVDISSKVAGKIQRIQFEEGDDVRAGQIIATLDSEEIAGQVAQARGNLRAAEAAYADLLAGTRPEDIRRAQAQNEGAVAALKRAQSQLDLVKSGPRSEQIEQLQQAYNSAKAQESIVREGPRKEEIEQLKAGLTQANATLDDAERELKRLQTLNERGAVASMQVDQQRTRRDVASAGVEAASQRLKQAQTGSRAQEISAAAAATEAAHQRLIEAKRGARPQERDEAEAAVAQARTQVDAARAALDLAIAGPTKENLAAAKARVDQAKGALDAISASEDETTIIAPSNGRVTIRNVEPGELVTPGQPIVRMAKLDKVWIRIYVAEQKIGQIKIGQHASITTDAYTKHKYTGRVIQIGQEPEFTPKNVQTKEERVKLMYGIKIEIENPRYELKPGMPGDAAIDVK